ncbi:hypothetical protein [Oceanispirochaeta sp.]|jgi:predicted Zn-dependent protease|uniref:tetratricopeptide repeat protein n=1 Tax=Oceanispirochaeta sp. TaxID=2035350 RepID=UPI002631F8B6|nr:hypothetical protein [Oceanispirochaeta sp.]MDA3957681.1 hypothetical protein [Oceanispirochaeta sp.]
MQFLKIYLLLGIFVSIISCQKSPGEKTYSEYARALQYYYQGYISEAEGLFAEIQNEFPHFYQNTRMYAKCLYYQGKQEQAAKFWMILQEENEMDIDSIKCLTSYLVQKGRSVDAIPLLRTGLSQSSQDPMLLYLMAQCRCLEGDVSQGLSLLLSAVTEMERQVVIPLELARVYHSFGFTKEARDVLERYSEYLGEDHPLRPALTELSSSLETGIQQE